MPLVNRYDQILMLMENLPYFLEDHRLLETLADISYICGQRGFFSGDSRQDIAEFIRWAREFEAIHEDTDWDEIDYHDTIEAFAQNKLRIGVE